MRTTPLPAPRAAARGASCWGARSPPPAVPAPSAGGGGAPSSSEQALESDSRRKNYLGWSNATSSDGRTWRTERRVKGADRRSLRSRRMCNTVVVTSGGGGGEKILEKADRNYSSSSSSFFVAKTRPCVSPMGRGGSLGGGTKGVKKNPSIVEGPSFPTCLLRR